ncbi:MAG: molybdenum cofactor biosynthesis protein MoaB [Marinilabiliales bacterium]
MGNLPETLNVLVITISDRASRGEYDDLCGPEINKILEKHFSKSKFNINIENILIPDSEAELLKTLTGEKEVRDIIITTGGTGIGSNDITVDVIKPMLEKEIPGIMEMIRVKYGAKNPNALLSRSIAGIIGHCLVYTLPGSPNAVRDYMKEILKTLEHAFYMMHDEDIHGTQKKAQTSNKKKSKK